MDGKQIFQCRASSSLSNIVGNATLVVKEFIEGLFPPGFLKSIYIDTTMSSLQVQENQDDVYKRERPFLVIRPKVNIDESHIFGRLPDWTYTTYFNYTDGKDTYVPVFADLDQGIYVYAAPDRIKIDYDVEIYTGTKMQQINIAHFLKGSARHKGYFYIYNTIMETEVPKLFIKLIAEMQDKDLCHPDEHAEFIQYLETNSQSFVTEKIKASSGNPVYCYKYKVNMLSLFEEYPEMDDGQEKDHIQYNFRVIERFSVDFTIPSNFFLETKRVIKTDPSEFNKWDIVDLEDKVLLNYTMKLIPDKVIKKDNRTYVFQRKQAYITDDPSELTITDYKNEQYAKMLYKNNCIHAIKDDDTNNYILRCNTLDILDLSNFLTRDSKRVIEYDNKYHVNNNKVFLFKIYEDEHEVKEDNIFIDWEHLLLFNFNAKPDSTYHIFFYKSNEDYNRLLDRCLEIDMHKVAKTKTTYKAKE